jgi:outer membrane protein
MARYLFQYKNFHNKYPIKVQRGMNYKMARKIFFICSAFFLYNAQTLCAQDSSVNITLNDAVAMSIKNSKQLKNSRAKIDEATAVLHQAKDQRLPDFKVSGSYLRLNNPNVNLKVKTGNSSDSGSNIKVSQLFYGLANVTYPLYSGMRIQYGIESAKYLEQAAKFDADNDREAIILNAINAYINLYKSKAAVVLVQENLQQSKQRDTDFSNLERNGILARNDLLKSELQTSNIELSLLDAENNWKLANLNMDLMLGLPEKTQLIQDSSSLQAPGTLQDIISYEQSAMQNRKDMKALYTRQKAAGVEIKSAKSEYYPGIALSGGYVAADIPGLLTVTNAFNIGVGVQYSLSSLWKTKAKVDQAKAREQQLSANEEMLNDNIKYQVNDAYNGYLLTLKKIDVYNKAIDQSQENYKITKNKYDNSLATLTDLLEADVARLQAKLNFAFAKADAVGAYNKLMQSAGLLNDQTTSK